MLLCRQMTDLFTESTVLSTERQYPQEAATSQPAYPTYPTTRRPAYPSRPAYPTYPPNPRPPSPARSGQFRGHYCRSAGAAENGGRGENAARLNSFLCIFMSYSVLFVFWRIV